MVEYRFMFFFFEKDTVDFLADNAFSIGRSLCVLFT